MSASLVGSEMCIRDSRSTAGQPTTNKLDINMIVEGTDRQGMISLPFAESVSYTHLTLPTICSV
eukprot:2060033-Alexandrium_andersonii.AAC.1